ncbi:MAG: DNA alkylation repair protein [Oscillospiraceae bacterium]|nr:DNA alkylation repair protein [Oscillospiraceae bacterium]
MKDIEKSIQNRLFELQDLKYKDFQSKLIPTAQPETVIGVRTPELRKFAKELAKTADAAEFIKILPHKYYEENNLHGFLLEKIKDYDKLITAIDNFLSYVDNWATCDLMSPPIFKKHTEELLRKIREWIKSEHTYTIRFGIKMLMSFYLDDNFKEEYLELVADVKSEEYYVNMMIAWYFATALAKQYDSAVRYLENCRLDKWVHNKTIQKAVESYRITEERKEYLKSLRIK